MRVLHVGKFFPPHPGGIERCVADLHRTLPDFGVTSAVIAHAEPGQRKTQASLAECDVTLVGCYGRFAFTPISPDFPRQLARAIDRHRPDILHLHLPNPSAFFALMSNRARSIPWVVHWHADIPLDSSKFRLRLGYRIYRPYEQALLKRAVAVVATSQAYAETSSALQPWLAKTQVIPLGIAASGPEPGSTLASMGADDAPLKILAVGRLSYFKGFDVLLRAIAVLPMARLRLIGDGECAAMLRRLAQDLKIENRVEFSGRVSMDALGEATLARAYDDADVFCLPSTERAESFGLVALEAMRAGRPVVASAIPGSGIGYVVEDGITGLLVPPGDSGAIAGALMRLNNDPAMRTRLGTAGRKRWQELFTLAASAQRWADLYSQIPAATQRRGAAVRAT